MNQEKRDRELGMGRRITRRDFLNGVAVGIGALGTAGLSELASGAASGKGHPPAGSYPPALTGMRGSQPGAFDVAHALRDGTFWETAGNPADTGETYDLIVVGGGISGLAAAYFYRKQAGPNSRILILDNHDDFGGHARRNEFRVGNRLLLSNGGTQSIESPSEYSEVAKGVLQELGIETKKFYKAYDQKLYSHLGTACFFDKETLAKTAWCRAWARSPGRSFSTRLRFRKKCGSEIARLYTEKKDYLPGLSREEKQARLARISYAGFLTDICHADPAVLPFFQTYTHDLFAVGIEAISALACYRNPDDYGAYQYAGFDGMDLGETAEDEGEPYIFHFPDGNASVARLLVRSLVPGCIPGHTMEDIVTARADYGKLDQPSSRNSYSSERNGCAGAASWSARCGERS